MANSFSFYYQNTRGLRTKIARGLKDTITLRNYDIIGLTETWLNENFSSESIFDDDTYITHRSDRTQRTYVPANDSTNSDSCSLIGGGALIAIKRNISAIRHKQWESEIPFDNVWLQINTNNGRKIFVNCIYINHNSNFDKLNEYFDHLYDIINIKEPDSHFIIVGDFNLSCIEWLYTTDKCIALSYEGRMANELINTLVLTDLKQINPIKNNYNRILDLVLTNMNNMTVTRSNGIVQEDPYHPAIIFKLDSKQIKFMKCKKSHKYNFFKADFASINTSLSKINWEWQFRNLNINQAVTKYYNIVNDFIAKFTPSCSPRSEDFPKWYSNKLIRLIQDKETYFKLKKQYNNEHFITLFKQKRNEIKKEKKKCLYNYQNNIESLIQTNPKSFFAYTKSLSKSNKLPPIMKYKGLIANNLKETVNHFATHFSNVYVENNTDFHINCDSNCNNYMEITMANIIEIIEKLDKNKTNSPDGIPALFYINTIENIAKPLTLLFKLSILEMKYPDSFKTSIISPIYKSGDQDDVENYRPISIISTIAKIFDKLIYNHLSTLTSHLLVHNQHGFTKGKSTLTNLMEYVDYLSNNMMNGGQIDAIYMDLAKAFDRIDHCILLKKLSDLQLDPCLIILIKSYLVNRKQIVCVYGEKSDLITPHSSVPQGSILSPLLFALFINDLPPKIKSKILLFADDLKLFTKIKNFDDALRIQRDIDTIIAWCRENKLQLNSNKCFVISFTRRHAPTFQHFNYNINGQSLDRINSIKDLGVIFDSKLSFENHTQNTISKACRMLGFISRSLNKFKKIDTYKTLFNTYVKSILEYCSTVWNPYYHNRTDAIERVQRRFTRMLYRKFHYPYEAYNARLLRLEIISLENRRLLNGEITLYKINKGIFRMQTERDFQSNITRVTRNTAIFYLPSVSTNVEFYSPMLRIHRMHLDCFSELDLNEPSTSAFKRYAYHLTKQLQPNISYQ